MKQLEMMTNSSALVRRKVDDGITRVPAEWELETEADDSQGNYRDDISMPASPRTLTRLYRAFQVLQGSIEVDPQKRGGVPVLAGTRFKAAQLRAQIADGDSIDDLEDDLGLNRAVMQQFLQSLSVCLDWRWTTPHESP